MDRSNGDTYFEAIGTCFAIHRISTSSAISGEVEDLCRGDQEFYSTLILKSCRSAANIWVSFLVKLEIALKIVIRIFHLPPGPLDSQLTLAIDHIYIVWRDKLKRSLRFIFSILGIDYGHSVARCSTF